TIVTLRRVAFLLGIIGMLALLLFRYPICQLTFGNTDHVDALALLSVIIFFTEVSGGQAALIQGLRHIGDLARLNILGALLGTLFSIPLVYFWGEPGIAPFLVVTAAAGTLTSWYYARRISIPQIKVPWKEITAESRGLLRLGLAFMASGLMSLGAMYFVRVVIVRQLGLDAAGLFQAASAIATLYVGFILSAMGADFYPRLTAVANDDAACNRMVNEQAEISLLLAVPGVLATLTFAPFVIRIFYAASFAPAIDILRWQVLGAFLRVASWPLGYILLAQGRGKIFLCTEFSYNAVQIGLVLVLLHYFGLPGTGMAFFGVNLFSLLLIFAVVRRLSGFSWSASNIRVAALTVPGVTTVFLAVYFLPGILSTAAGGAMTLALGCYCAYTLRSAVGPDKIQEIFQRWRYKIHLPGQRS
ncbi:MAG: O-antigen translocase, partial [Syntrophobacteraceae bacterium]